MDVKLRVNMIIDGVFVKFGSMIDESKIPSNLRRKRYIVRPGEKDIDEMRFRAQASAVENDMDMEEITIDDGIAPQKLVNRRAKLYNDG